MLTFVINITIKQAQATSPSQPLCCQVPKEDCNQVQKTNYVSVTKQQCGDVPDHFCVDIQEKTCQISQKPVFTACASTIVVYFNVSVILFKIKWPPRQGRHCELSKSVVLFLLPSMSIQPNSIESLLSLVLCDGALVEILKLIHNQHCKSF